jgi:hypothetical protein
VVNVRPESSSLRIVLCRRSILPVVVGEYGAVRMWRIPLWWQIRSKATVAGGWASLPVKDLGVVGQDLLGDAVARKGLAHRPGRRSVDELGHHAVAGVVVERRGC